MVEWPRKHRTHLGATDPCTGAVPGRTGHRLRSPAVRLLTALLASAVTISASAAPSNIGPTVQAIHVGIEGQFKVGTWTPVRIELQAGVRQFAGQVIVQATDPNGVPAQYLGPAIRLQPHEDANVITYFKAGQPSGDLIVVIRSASGAQTTHTVPAAKITPPLASDQQLVLTLGTDVHAGDARLQLPMSQRWVGHRIVAPENLPRHWLGYSSVDAIVVTTALDEPLAGIDDLQWTALRRWVELGGTIIASGAIRSHRWFESGRPLSWIVPGEIKRVVKHRQTTGIEQFAEATRRLDHVAAGGVAFSLPMIALRNTRGRVEATEGFGDQRSAAVVRSTWGLGRVIFVAFDLEVPPVSDWSDRSRLINKLLSHALDSASNDEGGRTGMGPVAHVGYTDMIGQLHRALDQFNGVRLIPFSWVAGLIALYILIIGPLDYWLLRRLRRPEWTWLTFLTSVIAFTALAAVLSYGWKGNEFQCNQLTLIDADASTGIVRGTTWAHIFSPATRKIQLMTDPSADFNWTTPASQMTSWQGLPGDGFGGLDRHDQTDSFKQPYEVRLSVSPPALADATLEQFPIAVWSSQSLLGQWWGQTRWNDNPSQLQASVDATLTGTISNPIPADLDDTYLLYDRWAYRLGTLKKDSAIPISSAIEIDFQSLLTQRRVVKGRNVVTPWDQEENDIDRVMQMVMFYGAAKGHAYTRLQHRFQRTVDWSDRLLLNQAVLWGRSRTAGANLLLDGQPIANTSDWTYYRLLIPVTQPREY